MRAAAQFPRVVADFDHPDVVAVLLPEERDRAHRLGLLNGRDKGTHVEVVDKDVVDLVLGVPQYRGRHRAGGREVETQPSRRVLRACLRGRLAERAAERAVDEVGRGVRPGDGPPALDVDLRVHGIAD